MVTRLILLPIELHQSSILPNNNLILESGETVLLSPDIVLLHPGESRRPESGYFGAHQWLQTDIACFGHEDCADAQSQIRWPRLGD
jgi:hypothetical protein